MKCCVLFFLVLVSVISEYKQKLEKSIKAQKAEHDQKLIQLEDNLEKEKNKHEKHSADLKQKFDTLQQHFNLLQVCILFFIRLLRIRFNCVVINIYGHK